MNTQQIIVTIAPDGSVQVHTIGFSGKACLATTQDLIDSLGEITSQKSTTEMKQTATVPQTKVAR